MENNGSYLSISHLHFSYGSQPIIKDLNLEIKKGELWGVIGPNGAGKTTLLRLILGLLAPFSGQVMLLNRDVLTYKRIELAKYISLVPQIQDFTFPYSVMEVVEMGRYPHLPPFRLPSKYDQEIVRECLLKVGLIKLADRNMSELSGGERQRVMIARALAQQAEIMLLDEPSVHLDLKYQQELCQLLIEENQEKNLTIIMVSHDINLALSISHKILILGAEPGIYIYGKPGEVIKEDILSQIFQCEILIQQDEIASLPFVRPLFLKRENLDKS